MKIQYKVSLSILILLFSLIYFPAFSLAQSYKNGNIKQGNGKITGKVIDSKTNEPVEFATISIIKKADSSIVTGAQTDQKGIFIIESIPLNTYFVKINFLGYNSYSSLPIELNIQNPEKYVGNIKLEPLTETLKEVSVTGEKGVFQMGIDKKVFNVDQNIISAGGSASDVLQNVPSLSVDIEGNVSLRGSENIRILIDGKPSGLTGTSKADILEQIPASAIESIELITNPSAKYDADGMAGIINIILKKNKSGGINGNASVSAGTRNKYSAATGINFRNDKLNLSANYNYRYNERFGKGKSLRTSFLLDSINYLDQNSNSNNANSNHSFKIASDFYLPRKSTISLSIAPSFKVSDASSVILSEFLNENKVISSSSNRLNINDEIGNNVDASISYKKIFLKPKQEFSADFVFSSGLEDENNNYINDYIISDFMTDASVNQYEKIVNKSKNNLLSFQTDYTQTIGKKYYLETGLKSTLRKNDEQNNAFISSANPTELIVDNKLTNIFINTENVYAAYQNLAGTFGKTGVQLGTRIEYTDNKLEQKSTLETFRKKYLSFFPSLFIKQSFNKKSELQLSYSRRISRPNSRYTNPFIDYSDPLNIRFGNPNINPEFTNAFEISYQTIVKATSLVSSIYLRQTNDVIQSIRQLSGGDTTISTFANLTKNQSIGAEFVSKTQIKEWWNTTTTVNLYSSQLNGNISGLAVDRNNFNYSIQFMSIMKPIKDFSIQVSSNYRSESITPQSRIRAIYSTDIGVKKDILKSKGSISLSVSDIFDTRKFVFMTETPSFNQNNDRKRESQIATISFSYRFGKIIENLNNRRRKNSDMQGDQNQDFGE